MVNNPLRMPSISWGKRGIGGVGPLDSHDFMNCCFGSLRILIGDETNLNLFFGREEEGKNNQTLRCFRKAQNVFGKSRFE